MNNKNRSCVWGQITDFRSFSKEVQEVASKGIRMKIGNGAHTRFWFDNWAGGNSLRLSFPRLFMLSTQKQDLVREMGIWVNGEWRWVFNWRRNLFAWEEESFRDLINVVNLTKLSENVNDRRVWSSDLSNSFSVSDFGLQVTKIMEDESSPQVQGRLAWRNIAPPRAQLQVWFLLQGKINTKERLFRLGAARIEDDRCILCKEETETVEHLFFCCKSSSNLWYHCCKCWDLSFCLPKDPKTCLLSWVGTPFRRFDKRLWTAMFYVVAWTIWDIRNKMAFQDFKPNWEFEKKRLFWRLGTWAKGWCPDFPFAPGLLEDELKVVRGWAGTRAPRRGRLC